jgi:hypothetical protein
MFDKGTTEIFLTGKEDEQSGEIGLAFDGSQYVFRTATLGAHDLIEHVNGVENIGTITDELQASGSAHYTRIQTGHNVTEDGMVNDMLSIASDSNLGEVDFGPIIPEQPESDNDDSFEWIIETFRNKIGNELDDEDLEYFDIDQFCDQALQCMRLGESKQESRFKTPWEACEAFMAIESAINQHFNISNPKSYKIIECDEHQQYKLTINNDENGLTVFMEDHFEFDDVLCPECQNCVLEDGECEDCNE